MDHTSATQTPRTALRPTLIGVAVVTAVVIGTLGFQSASSSASSSSEPHATGASRGQSQAAPSSVPSLSDVRRGDRGHAATEDDGALPDGVTVFDDEYPGVANLDRELLQALRRAARVGGDEDIEFTLNSGWRSPDYQDQLLREAVRRYGSLGEAARWVATADTSPHVTGDAIDIGSVDATAWLSEHGADYGLCQIYRNEPWHFELRPKAIDRGCPPTFADPTRDPRMRP